MRLFIATYLLLIATALPTAARAQTTLDFFTGNVLGSGAVVGMGGAFIGLGEGADGHLFQPAAFSTRAWHARQSHLDYDLSTGSLSNDDDRAQSEDGTAIIRRRYSQLGFNVKLGAWGYGLHGMARDFVVKTERPGGERQALVRQNYGGLGFAQSRGRGSWHWGTILAATRMSLFKAVDKQRVGDALAAIKGGGLLFGWLWTPIAKPYRFGAMMRTPMLATTPTGRIDPGLVDVLPEAISLPGQIGVGGSIQFGPRPFNTRLFEKNAKPLSTPDRRHLLLAADLVATAPSRQAYDTRAFLVGEQVESGRSPSLSLRAGAQSEVVANRLIVRGGTYFEPCRRSGCAGRWHATGGMEMRIRAIWDLRFGVTVDLAKRYQNAGVGLGLWH
jgi:hypothetical protein